MAERKHEKKETKYRIAVVTWLAVTCVIGLIKIIVGCVYMDSGCLGLGLLPPYLLLAGLLALIPVVISLLATCSVHRDQLQQLWGPMAVIFLLSLILVLAGTLYMLTSVVRVSSLDRLCTHTWVPVFGLCAVASDWLLFFFFYRLFCVNELPRLPATTPVTTLQEESPFHVWKQRQTREMM